jgi:hypothetical protein
MLHDFGFMNYYAPAEPVSASDFLSNSLKSKVLDSESSSE